MSEPLTPEQIETIRAEARHADDRDVLRLLATIDTERAAHDIMRMERDATYETWRENAEATRLLRVRVARLESCLAAIVAVCVAGIERGEERAALCGVKTLASVVTPP